MILISLFDSLAIWGLVGHKSLTNLSLSLRVLKFGSIEDILPNRQFLSTEKIGQEIRKCCSVSTWAQGDPVLDVWLQDVVGGVHVLDGGYGLGGGAGALQ